MRQRTTRRRPSWAVLAAAAALIVPAAFASAQWTAVGTRIYYNSGNVGIGTGNPAYRLDVRSNQTRAISAFNTATTGYTYAVFATARSVNGRGVYGIAQNTQGNGSGVFGVSNGRQGRGLFGYANNNTGGRSYGVYGKAKSTGGSGVYGEGIGGPGVIGTTAATNDGLGTGAGSAAGVRGIVSANSPGANSAGVWGINNGVGLNGFGVAGYHAGSGYGVYGQADGTNGRAIVGLASSGNGYAGYFAGGKNYFQGKVGLGTTDPQHALDVAGDIKIRTGDKFYFGTPTETSTNPIYFNRRNISATRADLYAEIGGTGDAIEDFLAIAPQGASGVVWLGNQGDCFKPGGGSWTNSSDRRVKKDIHTLDGSLDRLLQLRGVSFRYTDLTVPGAAEGLRTGFIAQEVQSVFPEWITHVPTAGKYDDLLGVSISGFEAIAVEAMRELNTKTGTNAGRVARLEAGNDASAQRVARLEAENRDLRDRLEQLEAMMAQLLEK